MSIPATLGLVLAGLGAYEATRYAAVRWLQRRWQRSIGDFLRRHAVQLEQFRFIDRVWVRQTLLQDPEIDREAATLAAASGLPMCDVRFRIESYLDEIVPYFNLFSYYKVGAAAARSAVRFCYELVFDGASLERARLAVPAGAVTVYVANHRSNADYVVLSVGALRQVALSYAVGEWARVWPLDWLFRSFGSYFVRRGERDPLYHRVLERYLQLVASRGLTTAFFLEGGLSRDGALRAPRIGLLDYLVGILRTEPTRRIVFIPVGINYDRVLEDRQLLDGSGPPSRLQKAASLGAIVARAPLMLAAAFTRAAFRSHQKYGYAAVSFGVPLPLEELLESPAEVALLPDAARRPAMAALADRLLLHVAKAIPATPIALVCGALLDDVTDVPSLRRNVRDRIATARAEGRAIAQGDAFAGVKRGRQENVGGEGDKDDLDRDILDAEEAERTVDLALRLLRRRGVVSLADGRLAIAAGATELVRYYARSLDAPTNFAARPG